MTTDGKQSTALAINGGTPIRTEPLPWELPGAHWIGDEELDLVSRVVRAQSPFRYYGADLQHMVDQLEGEWQTRLSRKHALAVNCGTQALHICLAAMGVGPGDEVLVPGYMWVSCISAVVRLGAIPRLVDIDDTFCMSVTDLEAKLNSRSKAILYVNMSGAPGHIDQIKDLAKQRGLWLLEDCCAGSRGQPCGAFGDMAIFSFQLNKNLTSGEGGLIVCDDDHLYKRAFAIHDLGFSRNAAGRLDPSDPNYQLWGVGARMSELSGAMALAQTRKLDQITAAMRTAKWRIRERLAAIPGIDLRNVLDPSGDSGPFMLMRFQTGALAQQIVEAVRAEGVRGPEGSLACLTLKDWGLHWYFNVQSLVHKRSIADSGFPWSHPDNAFHAQIDYSRGTLPVCDHYHDRGALLTVASRLSDQDIDDIASAFEKVCGVLLMP
ncbi:LOW QUALITY PROTEIN: putative PLP-dependent enzyme possibly involved in cell wall biogenesis [Thiorhodovibrio frisius]|uniref:Putative PLP-dependent enzyme possibly involved in cell wall biogenesis n=2 Tax=Thiorhodovibrio frisius TaxID=631362 RepID=H8YXA2_9GAMM|nr:LOW QUALITY PROTEIN: putative PLP-dependent enzyme possibly involved in cell wall biogenesis [Thiorhodovibrio frisius]